MLRRVSSAALFFVCLAACGGGSETNETTTTLVEEVPLVTTTQIEETAETPTTVAEQIVGVIPTTTTIDPSWTGPVYPLTGLPAYEGIPETPAVVVKIGNNDQNSLPQHGLREADIVYDVRIENGKSRFMAVYHSRLPEVVMPVRSARSSDINLLLNLNHPVFVYWGSNDIVLEEIKSAEWSGGYDSRSAASQWGEQYFNRDSSRSRPANGKVNIGDLQETASNEAEVPVAIFEYGELTSNAVPAAGVQWTITRRVVDYIWNSSLEQWVRYQDGVPHLDENGTSLTVDNLLFLYIGYGISDADPSSPQAISTGSGDGWLLRDGTVTGVTWERSRSSDNWTIVDDESGEMVPLDVGTTWVTLAKPGEGRILSSAEAIELIG